MYILGTYTKYCRVEGVPVSAADSPTPKGFVAVLTLVSLLDLLVGSSIGQRVVVLGTLALYGYLVVRRPGDARASAESGARTLVSLATLILAALLLASAVETLVPPSAISGLVGGAAGTEGVVLAGFLGGVLPGGPYAVYPIVSSVAANGASTAAVLAMIVGYGGIGLARVSYGLVFFEARIVAARVAIGVVVTVLFAFLAAWVIGA